MSIEELVAGLCGEAGEALRPLLVKAYERGYREGLASAGQPAPAERVEVPVVPPPPPEPAPARVEWSAPSEEPGEAEGEPEDEADDAVVVRPILPHATVGTLRRRINRVFDLERFDIDVVVCRRGDPDRRQIKSTARLGLYRREES